VSVSSSSLRRLLPSIVVLSLLRAGSPSSLFMFLTSLVVSMSVTSLELLCSRTGERGIGMVVVGVVVAYALHCNNSNFWRDFLFVILPNLNICATYLSGLFHAVYDSHIVHVSFASFYISKYMLLKIN
jgi:hypothetical protein